MVCVLYISKRNAERYVTYSYYNIIQVHAMHEYDIIVFNWCSLIDLMLLSMYVPHAN